MAGLIDIPMIQCYNTAKYFRKRTDANDARPKGRTIYSTMIIRRNKAHDEC